MVIELVADNPNKHLWIKNLVCEGAEEYHGGKSHECVASFRQEDI
jgi:hypothetical protein